MSFSLDITISGKVTDTGTTPLPNAAVKLEKYGLTATSDINGNFTLTGTVGINSNLKQLQPHNLSATIHNGIVCLTVHEKTSVEIITYTVQGKAVSFVQKIVDAGTHSISLPHKGTGVYVYMIKAGKSELFIKSHSSSTVSAKRPGGHALIDDVIAVTKDGYLNYRVIVTNSDTSNIEIKMIVCVDTVRDIDGNFYQAVKIGNQLWTVSNLRVVKYNDGAAIPKIINADTWNSCLDTKIGAYCYYNNTTNADSIKKYGALYNWYAIDTKKLPPAGWHVPTDAEWTMLENYLVLNGYNWDGTTDTSIYNKIAKSVATKTDWLTSTYAGAIGNNLIANNRTGFSAIPHGLRFCNGQFGFQGGDCYWWIAKEDDSLHAWNRRLAYVSENLNSNCDYKSYGFSVRLLRD
jgi:uncharacterized protein (TIGR02145 family)